MDAVFKLTSPELTSMTLTLTADVIAWRSLLKEIRTLDTTSGSALDVFGRQIATLIESAGRSLARETWTTGYATGEREAVPS